MPIDLEDLHERKRKLSDGGVVRRFYRRDNGVEVCGAQLRNKGKQVRCSQRALAPNGRCRIHGGAVGSGRPPVHGRWTQASGRFAEAYQRAKEDPGLVDLRRPLALLDLQVEEALRLAADGDCPSFRARAREAFLAVEGAAAAGDPVAMQEGIANLGEVLEEGAKQSEVQRHLVDITERFSKRLEKAWDIRLARGNAVNARDLVSILGRIVDAIQQAAPPDVARRVLHTVDVEFRDIAGLAPAAGER